MCLYMPGEFGRFGLQMYAILKQPHVNLRKT